MNERIAFLCLAEASCRSRSIFVSLTYYSLLGLEPQLIQRSPTILHDLQKNLAIMYSVSWWGFEKIIQVWRCRFLMVGRSIELFQFFHTSNTRVTRRTTWAHHPTLGAEITTRDVGHGVRGGTVNATGRHGSGEMTTTIAGKTDQAIEAITRDTGLTGQGQETGTKDTDQSARQMQRKRH